ncbi:MAG: glycerophosphoryl diester phosphodiesterase, partial [Lentimonas sp.]
MKIFSHRGLSDSKTRENSLDAFKKAFEKGIRALEVDIWCLENELFLTHDHTYKPENLNKLEELFSEFGNDVFYWLDFKNLSPKNTLDVMKKVKKITK